MAGRVGMRHVARRFFSSGGKVLSEEEKAAENVFIKKMEKEKLAKAARQGPKAAEQTPATPTAASGDAKAGPSVHESSTEGHSTDKNRNYGVLAGTVAIAGAIGWYLLSKPKKSEDKVSD
ncbi:copper ion binding protein [Carex rostrata]